MNILMDQRPSRRADILRRFLLAAPSAAFSAGEILQHYFAKKARHFAYFAKFHFKNSTSFLRSSRGNETQISRIPPLFADRLWAFMRFRTANFPKISDPFRDRASEWPAKMLHFPTQVLAITNLNLFYLGLHAGTLAETHPFFSDRFQLVVSSLLLSLNERISGHSFRATQLPFTRSKRSPNSRLSLVSTFYRFLILLSLAGQGTGLFLAGSAFSAPEVRHARLYGSNSAVAFYKYVKWKIFQLSQSICYG
jgi:hypothetical protein